MVQAHLWQGRSHVPGPNLDMYSGLAKAYSMYMVLSFLKCYLALVLPTAYTIPVYCDNKGLVDWLNCTANHKYPQDSIQDNYPIVGKIQHTILVLLPVAVTISHIKGHQDKAKLDQPLTIPETLNVDCNKWASKAMLTYPDTTPTNHPMTTIGYPHLLINDAIQFRQLQNQLQTAATQGNYQKYMQTKFLWNKAQYDSIQWPAFQLAFQQLARNK